MIDPKDSQKMDQHSAFICEHFPSLWHNLYVNCIKEGFTEFQSLDLVKTYIRSFNDSSKS